ncbi:MAG TPA: hypothetical protein VMY76_10160 [Gemmatimonadales bacterium]|nr:hypothetical protein [Gemmatimonadales bacterium]
MSDWGITTKVPAEVVLAEGIVLAGDLHLYARPTYPPGPETVLEMLNRTETFFALSKDGTVTFIPKAQVVVVSCRDQAILGDPDRVSAARHIELEVVVQGGAEYRGRVAFELPPSRNRTLDYLNGSGVFFGLGSDDINWYVNKSRVRIARPLD